MKKALKKLIGITMATVLTLSLLSGCSAGSTTSTTKAAATNDKKIAVVCSSAGQNDNGYNQSAVEGAKQVSTELGMQYKVVEPTNGVPAALEALAADGYNVIFRSLINISEP